jgi:hypothetical protein
MSATTTAAGMSFTDPNQVPGGVGTSVDPQYYMQQNPDVAASGMSAQEHYNQYGMDEGRTPNAGVAQVFQNTTNPTLPDGTAIDPTMIQNSPDQEQSYQQLSDTAPGSDTAAQATQQVAAQPGGAQASTYQAQTVNGQTPEMQAAQGTVDPRSMVEAQTADPSKNATVAGQLEQLLEGDMPWAAGAMRRANEEMARRGLGTSSMAGQAITQAAIESALPVAQADAGIWAQFEMANLNNRQQSAVLNAQKYHDINVKNLDNRQQARLMNQQARLNTLLSDQAATNAARQFNAASQTEVDKFNTNLEASINQFNAAQGNAMSQFNAGQQNSHAQFRATLQSQRETFNTQMRAQIDQSNVNWRRQINTANTAATNQAQQTNALNALNLSNWALNATWQQWRDEADHYFTSSESAKNRSYGLAYATLMNSFSKDMAEWQSDQATARALGGWASDVLNGLFKSDLFNF